VGSRIREVVNAYDERLSLLQGESCVYDFRQLLLDVHGLAVTHCVVGTVMSDTCMRDRNTRMIVDLQLMSGEEAR